MIGWTIEILCHLLVQLDLYFNPVSRFSISRLLKIEQNTQLHLFPIPVFRDVNKHAIALVDPWRQNKSYQFCL